jgi:heparan-alpha-glucosaminide N-acetyltransferase
MSAQAHILAPSKLTNVLTTERIYTIDALRGITILVMIFVNELAGVRGLPGWMKHAAADADTMTFVDVVFPSFLFIVGMSIPFAINNRLSKGDTTLTLFKHISFRTLGLLVLGVFMVNAEGGYNEDAMVMPLALWSLLFYACVILVWNNYSSVSKTVSLTLKLTGIAGLVALALLYKGGPNGGNGLTPQWWGILGLIGWAYLLSTTIYLLSRGSITILAIALALSLLFFMAGSMEGAAEFIRTQKGHATHTGIVVCGIITSLFFFDTKQNVSLRLRLTKALGFAITCVIAAVLLRPYYAISKIYATPSWALFSVAACVAVFALLYWLVDIRRTKGWTSFIQPAASNPLLTYIIPFIVLAIMSLFHLKWPAFLREGVPGVIWSAVYALAVMGLVIVLNKYKIKLQL